MNHNDLMRRIYLDHNATTPLDPRVLEAMLPILSDGFGNPSSLHWFGQQARATVENARGNVAALIGATPAEVVFTGSGTEADNMALRGLAATAKGGRKKIVITALEHHAVLHTAKALGAEGFEVAIVRATPEGRVDLDDAASKIDDGTAVMAIMLANNETGVVQPVAEMVGLARRAGAAVHCDAVQAAGKIPIDVNALDVDTLALSAHKFYGPKGVGILYVRRGVTLTALVRGGAQERNRRAGTENVAGLVGMGRAAQIARSELGAESARLSGLRDDLERRLLEFPGAAVNGAGERVPNTCNVSFQGADAESLVLALDLAGVAVSTGAACAAGAVEPSHVLKAMGLSAARLQGSLRFSLGRSTTAEDLTDTVEAVKAALDRQTAWRSRSVSAPTS